MQLCVICNSNPEILWPKRWQCWKENGKFSESLCKLLGLPKYYEPDLQDCAYCSGCQKKVYNIYLIVRKWDKLQEDITKLKKDLQDSFHDSVEQCMKGDGVSSGGVGSGGNTRKTDHEEAEDGKKLNSLRRKILKRLSRSHFTSDCDCNCCFDSKPEPSKGGKYCNDKCCEQWNHDHNDRGDDRTGSYGSDTGSDYSSGEDEDHDNCNLCCSSKEKKKECEKYCDDCPLCKEEQEKKNGKPENGGSGEGGEKRDIAKKPDVKFSLSLKGILSGKKNGTSKKSSPPPAPAPPPPSQPPKNSRKEKKKKSTTTPSRKKEVRKSNDNSQSANEIICMPTDNCMSGDGDESNAPGETRLLSIPKNKPKASVVVVPKKEKCEVKKEVSMSKLFMNGGNISDLSPKNQSTSPLKLHEDIPINYKETRYRCHRSNCIKTFATPEELDIHIKRHHEGVKFPFVCQQCGKSFERRRELDAHALKHEGKVAITCHICGRGFGSKSYFDMHMKRKHSEGTRKFKCSFCDKGFLSESKLKTHLTIHTKEYPFSCMVCGKGFSAKTFLTIHMSKHLESNPYKCNLCMKTFSSPRNLRIHQYTHDQTHPFRCPECFAGMPSETTLKQHMLKHEDEKSHVCHVCNSKFQFPSSLKKHLKIHKGDKRFVCEYCNKSFIDKYKLTRHVRTHSGEKLYECTLCQKRFATKDYLNTHMKKHNHNRVRGTKRSVPDSIPSSTISNASDESIHSFTFSTNSQSLSVSSGPPSQSQPHMNSNNSLMTPPPTSSSSVYIPPPAVPPAPASSIPKMVSLPEDDHPSQVDDLTATIQLENLSSEQLLMMDDEVDVVESSTYDSQNATSSDDVTHLMDLTPNSLLTPIFQSPEQLEMLNGDFCELSFQNL